MASGGSGPPLPPSGKSDKGKGKKSYVVKLITRIHNEIGSSSQPTTPTSTSTGTSVPSPLQVPGFTPTPHTSTPTSLPSPLQGPDLTPTSYQVPTNEMASLSPNVGSNLSTPTNIAPSPGTVDADPHSSAPNNDEEECSNNRPMITPVGGGFYPTRTASKAITQTHIRQSAGEFVDERSRRTHEQFQAKFAEIRSETASVGASACSPLDPAEEERLRNRCWLEVVGGKYKGRVYGIGNVNSQDDCVDSYIQQTQASSSTQQQNSEEIVNLKSLLQQYGQQLEKFQGFLASSCHSFRLQQPQLHKTFKLPKF
ncbi:hypothetical protein LR48_Vigan11g119200 [Vigna angularis]|uniref:Uncharacterized protein n=1 Tax=Phaseolus angularis TaxID=3914 RepID=A0A0L9VT83_PHAAN|nr:hypothetical protein LR48_Vigan11g119200 [Vigna angularis]